MEETNIRSGTITRIEAQKRDPERLSIFLDGEFAFGVSRLVAAEHSLHEGQQLNIAQSRDLLGAEEVSRATEAALQFLTYRPRSRREVETRLSQRGFSDIAVEKVIARLIEWKYLDDESFAQYWVENRAEHQPRGRRLLRQELRLKGVDSSAIEQALDVSPADETSDALVLARKRLSRLQDLDPDVQRRRLASFLQRRGYGWDVIRPVLDRLLGDVEDDTADE